MDPLPLTKVETITKGIEVPAEVKRPLLFGECVKRQLLFEECVKRQLSDNFSHLQDERSKRLFSTAVGGTVFKKYKLLIMCKSFLPYPYYKSNWHQTVISSISEEKEKVFKVLPR